MDPQSLIDDLNDILLQDHFRYIEVLGQGSFGIVLAAHSSHLDKVVAIKITQEVDQENEANLLHESHHPNIVRLYNVLAAKNRLYLIMEKLQGQTLDKLLHSQKMKEEDVRHIMTQILNALVFLHRKGIIHRDLKPENVFICHNNYVKLIDLGLGYQMICRGIKAQQVGTPYFVAPEIVNEMDYSEAVDIFSLGIMFFMMINQGVHPLWDGHMRKRDYYELISDEFEIKFPETMSDMAKDFVQNTVSYLPENRMRAQQCLEHPFIKGEGRKSHPTTRREIQLRFSGCQKILLLIKTLMVLQHMKQTCEEEIHYIKTERSHPTKTIEEEEPEIQEPQTARYIDQKCNFKSRKIHLKEKSIFGQNSQQDIINMKNKILIQRRYQMMISRFKEKSQTTIETPKPSQHKRFNHLPQMPTQLPNGGLRRQQSLNFH